MQSSVCSSDVAVLVMVAGTNTVPIRGRVHEHVSPNERLRFGWVQGCSYPLQVYTQNETGWTRREQEQTVRGSHVVLAQECCTRHVECAEVIGVVLSTAVVEHGR